MYYGEKVKLRGYKEADIELAEIYFSDYEIVKYMTGRIPYPATFNDEKKFIDSQSQMKTEYSFAIEDLESGKYIGGCGINEIDYQNSYALIGIVIGDKEFHGKGYGRDVMKTLIDFIFNEINVNKIKLNVYSFNERAKKCYEKCGFKVEGVLRKEIFRKGKFYDVIVMGILREEYFKI